MENSIQKSYLNYYLKFDTVENTVTCYFFSTLGQDLLKYTKELNYIDQKTKKLYYDLKYTNLRYKNIDDETKEKLQLLERKKEIIKEIYKDMVSKESFPDMFENFDIMLSNKREYQAKGVFDISGLKEYIDSNPQLRDFQKFPIAVMQTKPIKYKMANKVGEFLQSMNNVYNDLPEEFKKYSIACPFKLDSVAEGFAGSVYYKSKHNICKFVREKEITKLIKKNPQLLLSETEIQNNNQNNIVAINNVHEQQLDQTRG